jgi:hypothetical protein
MTRLGRSFPARPHVLRNQSAFASSSGSFALPAETSDGTSTATASAFRIRLPSPTGVGVATGSATAFKIKLSNGTSIGTGTATSGSAGAATPTLVQQGSKTLGSTATAHAVTMPGAIGTGNCLVVVVHESAGSGSGALISSIGLDAGSASFLVPSAVVTTSDPPSDAQSGINDMVSIAYAYNVTGGGTVVTVNLAVSKIASVRVFEFSGVVTSGTADATGGGGGGTAGTAMPAPSLTTTGGAVVVEAVTNPSGTLSSDAASSVPTTGWTFVAEDPSATVKGGSAYQFFVSGQTVQAAWVGSTSQKWGAVGVALRVAAGVANSGINIKLPSRSSVGTSSASALGFGSTIAFPAVTTIGVGTVTANNIKIKLPGQTSTGSAIATASNFRVRLPNQTGVAAGSSGSVAAAFRIKFATVRVREIRQVITHGTATSAVSGSTLDFSTSSAIKVGNHLIATFGHNDPALTITGIAVQSGVDPGNLTWRMITAGSGTGRVTIAYTQCPTGVNAGVSFRATWSGSCSARLAGMVEYSGMDVDAAVAEASQTATSTTGDPTVNITTLTNGALVHAAMVNSNATTATPNGFFVELYDLNAGGITLEAIHRLLSTATLSQPGSNMAVDAEWVIAAVSLKRSEGGYARATGLRVLLPSRTVIATATATAAALRIRLPSRTSAGTATALATGFRTRLPNVSSASTSSLVTSGLRIRFPARISAGTSTADETTLNLTVGSTTLPAETSDGTSAAIATALGSRLPSRTSAGASAATAAALRIRLPQVSTEGVGPDVLVGPDTLFPISLAGATATAAAFNIRLPSRTSAATSTATTALRVRFPSRTSQGSSTVTAAAFRIRLPNRTSVATSNISNAGLRVRLPNRVSAGSAAATATALKIRLRFVTSVGVGALTQAGIKIRLPNRTVGGLSSVQAIDLFPGGLVFFPGVMAAGTSSASQTTLRVRLPSRSAAGVGATVALSLRVKLPSVLAAGVAITTETYTQAVLADGPVSWWRLNETTGTTAVDAMGVANGTYVGGTLNQPSLLSFGGGGSYDLGNHVGKVNVSDIYDFVGNVPYSIELWVKVSDLVDTAFRTIIGKRPTTDGWLMNMVFSAGTPKSGRIIWERWVSGAAVQSTWVPSNNFPTFQPNRQNHIVGTYDGTSLRLYLNGTLMNTITAAPSLVDTTSGLALGAVNSSSGSTFVGAMGDVAIYNYALNLSQIRSHLSAAAGYGLQIKNPNVATAGSSSATGQPLSIRLPNRTSAGVATATATALRIRLPSRTSAGTSTVNQAGLRDKIGQVTSAGHSNITTTGLRIKLPSRTGVGTSSTTVTYLVGAMAPHASHGFSTATATQFKIRLPSRTAAGTSSTSQSGLRDRIAIVSSTGHSNATSQTLRIRLPNSSVSSSSTAVTVGLQVRLPSRTTQGISSSTAVSFRLGLIVFTSGDSDAAATPFLIRLSHATSDGVGGGFAYSFLYIPPPPKVVVAGGSGHTLTSSSTGHLVTGSSTTGTVTASSGRGVTAAGDMTRTVRVGP